MRGLLTKAEKALLEGDGTSAFRFAWDALRLARSEAGGHPYFPPSLSVSHEVGRLLEPAYKAIDWIHEYSDVARFTSDIAEWQWLEQAARRFDADRQEVHEADARRALLFVQEWVLGWEAFSARFEGGHTLRRAPRTDVGGPPKIIGLQLRPSHLGTTAAYRVHIQFADLPEAEEEDWAKVFLNLLNPRLKESESGFAWFVPGGRIWFDMKLGADPTEMAAIVNRALVDCEERWGDVARRRESKDLEDDELVRAYEAACSSTPRETAPFWGPVVVSYDWGDRRVQIALTDLGAMEGADPSELLQQRLPALKERDRSAVWLRPGSVNVPADGRDPTAVLGAISSCIDEAIANAKSIAAAAREEAAQLTGVETELIAAFGVSRMPDEDLPIRA